MHSNKIDYIDSISTKLLLESLPRPNKTEASLLPISTLAYLGDAIHGFFAKISSLNVLNVKEIHERVSGLVSRHSQARCLDQILPTLNEQEMGLVKRAMNSKTAKKYGNDEEYRKSTALEALIGYLYLVGDLDKMFRILMVSLTGAANDRVR
ncbi:ribonuclease III domain-containing protein [Pseudothermotoga sp.]|uniref:ribonuclease III domain-containing protein n=1 Tax=Pseudothermotoga sp. TaxID=2033661 RepID=UPI0031F68548